MTSFNRKLTLALLCAALTLLVLVVFGTYVSGAQQFNTQARLHARDQLDRVNELERSIAAAESAQRAYARASYHETCTTG